jgi:uncharacterized protein DUF973
MRLQTFVEVQAPPGVPQQSSAEERAGLAKVMWYSIISIAGLVGGWVVVFASFNTVFMSARSLNLPPNATSAQVSAALGPVFQNFSLLIPSIIAIALVGNIALMMGFRDLAKVDNRFSTPWKLMILLLVGAVVAAGGLTSLFGSIPNIISQAPATAGTPSTAFFSSISTLVGTILLIIVGGVLGLAGTIGGQILGLWGVGSRYNETVIKVGAILVIIPPLSAVAPILILVGAYSVRGRLRRDPSRI